MTPTAHPTPAPIARAELDRLAAAARTTTRTRLLGRTRTGGVTVRALRPLADSVRAELPDGSTVDLDPRVTRASASATLPTRDVPDYRLR